MIFTTTEFGLLTSFSPFFSFLLFFISCKLPDASRSLCPRSQQLLQGLNPSYCFYFVVASPENPSLEVSLSRGDLDVCEGGARQAGSVKSTAHSDM